MSLILIPLVMTIFATQARANQQQWQLQSLDHNIAVTLLLPDDALSYQISN